MHIRSKRRQTIWQIKLTKKQRLFDVKGETIGIAIHGNVNNHIPFLQRCPLSSNLRSFEMELVC